MATATFSPHVSRHQKEILNRILVTGIALFVVILFLAPLGYMFTTAVKSDSQMSDPNAPALDTAAASSGVVTPLIGAWMMG